MKRFLWFLIRTWYYWRHSDRVVRHEPQPDEKPGDARLAPDCLRHIVYLGADAYAVATKVEVKIMRAQINRLYYTLLGQKFPYDYRMNLPGDKYLYCDGYTVLKEDCDLIIHY